MTDIILLRRDWENGSRCYPININKKYILVGYNDDLKAYKIFTSSQWRRMVSRDVKFEENLTSKKYHDLPIETQIV